MNSNLVIPEKVSHLASFREEDLASLFSEFNSSYPSAAACQDELFDLAGIETNCRSCGSESVRPRPGGRSGKCVNCKKITWFTAGTVLDHMKEPKARLAAIWFAFKGVLLNSVVLSRLAGIKQSSAHGIMLWLHFLTLECLPGIAVDIHSSEFTGIFQRRSRETPARLGPVAEQAVIESDALFAECQDSFSADTQEVASVSSDFALTVQPGTCHELEDKLGEENSDESIRIKEANQLILEHLSDKPVHFDSLIGCTKLQVGFLSARLIFLEMEGKVKRCGGDWYVIRRTSPGLVASASPDQKKVIDGFFKFIKKNYRGISRRYLQGYLSAFWVFQRSNPWDSYEGWQMCLRSVPHKFKSEIRNYITPLFVKIVPM